jgi:hypothetical protein
MLNRPFYQLISNLHKDSFRAGGIRQTPKAPVNLRILGGFAIYVDGSVDGFFVF